MSLVILTNGRFRPWDREQGTH